MRPELYIARRLFKRGKGSLTRPVINISVVSVALGIAVLVLSLSILKGFQQEIRDKIIGFGAHIQVSWYDNNSSYEVEPIQYDSVLVSDIKSIPGVVHVQPYGIKAGIIKTDDQIEGIVLKGVGPEYNWSFFSSKIIEGKVPVIEQEKRSNEALISKHTASKMGFKTGDKVILYFIQEPPRFRSFTISGIYETGLQEFDEMYLFGDLRHIAKLNSWNEGMVSGFEVLIEDFDQLDAITEQVSDQIPPDLIALSIKDLNPQLFGWLALMDQNVVIILVITIMVALIHMTSALLILIIERTTMIGILKALGMDNISMRRLFLYNGAMLLLKGILWGNIVAITIALLQSYTGFIPLNQESYYLDKVPIALHFQDVLWVNGGVILICLLVMTIPSYIIGKITPVKAIRFD